jgi:hypothetical protein
MPKYGLADDPGSTRDAKAGQSEEPNSDVRHPLRTAEGIVVAVAVSAVMWLILAWVIWKFL